MATIQSQARIRKRANMLGLDRKLIRISPHCSGLFFCVPLFSVASCFFRISQKFPTCFGSAEAPDPFVRQARPGNCRPRNGRQHHPSFCVSRGSIISAESVSHGLRTHMHSWGAAGGHRVGKPLVDLADRRVSCAIHRQSIRVSVALIRSSGVWAFQSGFYSCRNRSASCTSGCETGPRSRSVARHVAARRKDPCRILPAARP